jgi:CBS domain-containing protein
MEWRRVRHVPVEDSRGRVVGVVAHRALLRALAAEPAARGGPVRAFMDESPILVSARLTLREAAQAVLRSEAGCLLVVEGRAPGGHRDRAQLCRIFHNALREERLIIEHLAQLFTLRSEPGSFFARSARLWRWGATG